MFSRTTVAALVCVLIAAVSGCRLIDGRFAEDDRPPRELSQSTLRALHKQLHKADWRSNPEWSLIDDTQTPSALRKYRDRPRWICGNELVVEILDLIDERKRADHSTDYLRKLAKEDSLAGWNAVILLAQREPHFATDHVDRLREIFDGKLHYDPKTGHRAPGPRPKPKEKDTGKPGTQKVNEEPEDAFLNRKHTLEEAIELAGGYESTKKPPPEPGLWDDLTKQWRNAFGVTEPEPDPGMAVSLRMQSAAAEAWCRVLAADFGDPGRNFVPALQMLRRMKLPLHVREELMRGVASHLPPSRIPNIDKSFPAMGDEVQVPPRMRRAGVEACVIYARAQRLKGNRRGAETDDSVWPAGLADRVYDPEPPIRILFGRWAALADLPETRKILSEQRRDINPTVQESALVSIGVWGGEEARDLLREAADDDSPSIRAAAVIGLSRWGAVETVRFLADSSDRVRMSVAKILGETGNSDSAILIDRLMRTSGASVQTECIRAVDDWSDQFAIPILLYGMSDGLNQTAEASWKALKKRRKKMTYRFPITGTVTERQRAVREIATSYKLPLIRQRRTVVDVVALSGEERNDLRTSMSGDLKTLTTAAPQSREYRQAVDRLKRLDRRALPELEKLIAKSWREFPDVLAESILPKLNPAYGHLWKLGDRDPLVRQRAAANLTAYSENASLSPLMLAMLEERISARPDRDVWRSALLAIMPESQPEHRWLVIRASQFPVPEIRRLACEYFAKHPQPDFADRVLELMNDNDNQTVQLAALRAAGSYHHPSILNGTKPSTPKKKTSDNAEPLRPRLGLINLLRSADREVSEAAAVSLARLGHETGYRELQRRSFDDDGRKRAIVYRLMGETGARRFIEHLILRGQKEQTYAARQAILAALEELTAPEERPVGLSSNSGYDKRIQVWQDWLQRRKQQAARSGTLRSSAVDSESERQR